MVHMLMEGEGERERERGGGEGVRVKTRAIMNNNVQHGAHSN